MRHKKAILSWAALFIVFSYLIYNAVFELFTPLTFYKHLMPEFWYLEDLYLGTSFDIKLTILMVFVYGAVMGISVVALHELVKEDK